MKNEKNDNKNNINIVKNPRSSLIIIINNIEFSRDFNYFISVEIEGIPEKKRTEVSGYFSKPIYKKNKFFFQLPQFSIENIGNLRFLAYIATDKENTNNDIRGKAKLLGECFLDLKLYKNTLTNISENGLFIPLKFIRDKNIVGKFFASIKLVGEDILLNKKEKELDFILPEFEMNLLPKNLFDSKIKYRVRVNLYSGLFLFKEKGKDLNDFPSIQCECSLSKNDKLVSQKELTKVQKNTENPVFNKQFLFPIKEDTYEDFKLEMKFTDIKNENFEENILFPLDLMQPFIPYNLEVFSTKFKNNSKARYYISFVLEKINENILEIIIKNFKIDPDFEVSGLNRYIFAMNFFKKNVENIFSPIKIKKGLIDGKIIDDLNKNKNDRLFLSTLLNYPFLQIENIYGGICYFCIPQDFLKKDPNIHLLLKSKTEQGLKKNDLDQNNANINLLKNSSIFQGKINIQITPFLDNGQNSIINLYKNNENNEFIEKDIINIFKNRNLSIKLFAKRPKIFQNENYGEDKEKENNKKTVKNKNLKRIDGLTDNEMQLLSDNLKTVLLISDEKDKWEIISKEISQKQDILAKLMSEFNNKGKILKTTVNQINELKKQLVLLEKENNRLKKKLDIEDGIELKNTLTVELKEMDENELRIKLIRVVQAYKEERMRNLQFEKSLQKAHQDLTQIKDIQKEFDELSVSHLKKNKILLRMQKEISKQSQYTNTIKKQELVIQKLQRNLEKCILKSEKYENIIGNISKIEKENEILKEEIKNESEKISGFESVEKIEDEVNRLEKIKKQLLKDLKYKNPVKKEVVKMNNNQIELEVEIQKYMKRISALEGQLLINSKKHATEIIYLQNKVNEKEIN